MTALQTLFQFEDGLSISFAVPEGVTDRETLVDHIKNHGGRVTEYVAEANFIVLSAEGATKERLWLPPAGGRVVHARWILESLDQQELQPWYSYELGVDKGDISDQLRDVKELICNLARYTPALSVDEVYIHLAKQFPHRTSHRFRCLHRENRYLVDPGADKLEKDINDFMVRSGFTPALRRVVNGIPANFGAEGGPSVIPPEPSNRTTLPVSGDDLQPVDFAIDNTDLSMGDDAFAIQEASISDTIIPDSDEEMIELPQRPPVVPAAVKPLASSGLLQVNTKRRAGGGKVTSPTGISVAMASVRSPTYHHRNSDGANCAEIPNSQDRGRRGSILKPIGPSRKGKERVLRSTSLAPPTDIKTEDLVAPVDEKPLPPIVTGPQQLLKMKGIPWRDPLPGIRGKDNAKKKRSKSLAWVNEAYCRRPRLPCQLGPDPEDMSANSTDIGAMARYLLSHDQGFFDEFYVDYRDGYKHERWDHWFSTHKNAIIEVGIELLQGSDFTWNPDRQTVRDQPYTPYLHPTWSEELTLNLTPFEEELLAKRWNAVKDAGAEDDPFCVSVAQQVDQFLETQSLTRAGHQMRPRWKSQWGKMPTATDQVKKRTMEQWAHRFQKNDRVGELIDMEKLDWSEGPEDYTPGCGCAEGCH